MIAILGDLHVDAFPNTPEIEQLILKTLRLTIDKAAKKGCTHFVLAGDVFNSPNPSQTSVAQVMEVFRSNKDLHFILILGNHDYSSTSTHSLQVAQWYGKDNKTNVTVIDQPTVREFEGTKLFLCPHPFVETSPEKVHWSIGHFAVSGARSDNGFVIKAKNQPKGNWILGDFHTPQSNRVNSCKYTYVGSMSQLSFQEKPKKRIIILDGKEKGSIRCPVSYELKQVKVQTLEQLENLNEENTYYRLIIEGNMVMPVGFMQNNPQVLRIANARKRENKSAQVLLGEKMVDPIEYLPNWLSNNHADHAERAMAIFETL